jgi:hypothetical protein
MASETGRLLRLSDGLLEQLLPCCQAHGIGLTALASSCRRLNILVRYKSYYQQRGTARISLLVRYN